MLKPLSDIIPVIEETSEGYYEVYQDAEGKEIKKVWHAEKKLIKKTERDVFEQELVDIINNDEYNDNYMVNSTLQAFQEKKKNESSFITLSDDGESASGVVKAVKQLSKVGFGGKEVEVIRLEIETKDGLKNFDKGSKQWVDEMVKNEVDVGSNITITRHGAKDDKKTTYKITTNKK